MVCMAFLFATLPQKREGNWTELTFAKTSGTVIRGKEKKMANSSTVRPSNDPRNHCGTHFVSSSLLVSKVANSSAVDCLKFTSCFVHFCRELSCYALYCVYIQVSQLRVTCLDEKKRSTLFPSFGLPNTARVSDIVVS